MSSQEVISVLVQTRDDASKELRKIQRSFKDIEKTVGKDAKSMELFNKQSSKLKKDITDMSRKIKEFNSAVGKNTKPFAGWAMSLMFAGMALKKMFDTVWKSSSKTFQEVSHSVANTTTGFDMLEGSMKFLQFVVGNALEPIAAWLVPIIDRISQFVEKHPGFVKISLVLTAILGTLSMLVGMTVLAANGVLDLATKLGLATTNAEGLTKIKWSRITDGLHSIKNAAKSAYTWLATHLRDALTWIRDNPLKSITGGLVLAGIILAVMWLIRLKEEMGGFGELFGNVGRGIMKILAILNAGFQASAVAMRMLLNPLEAFDARKVWDTYASAMDKNMTKLLQDLPAPEKGYLSEPRTLKQIWQADLYQEQMEAQQAVNQVFIQEMTVVPDTDNFEQFATSISKNLQSTGGF